MDNIADCRLQIADYYYRFRWGVKPKYRVQQSTGGGEHQFLILNAPYILIGCWLTPTAAGQTVDDDHP